MDIATIRAALASSVATARCGYSPVTSINPMKSKFARCGKQFEDLIGDYRRFFGDLLERSTRAGIDLEGCPVSHVAYRTETVEDYVRLRDRLRTLCISDVENVWNGRTIDKLLLEEPLDLAAGFRTSLIELIPPAHRGDYPMGLEHAGIVVGDAYDEFRDRHRDVLTGQQDQGPYCQPLYLTFDNNRTLKFYRWSLKDVVEMEGRTF